MQDVKSKKSEWVKVTRTKSEMQKVEEGEGQMPKSQNA